MYDRYSITNGLKILCFPCNQFAHQEPWPEPEIKKFLQEKYHVTFDLFAKVEVNGSKAHPLFKYMKMCLPGDFGDYIKWNFTKFLVDKHGQPKERFAPKVDPLEIEPDIVKLFYSS